MNRGSVKVGRLAWHVNWCGDIVKLKIKSDARVMCLSNDKWSDSGTWVCYVSRLDKDKDFIVHIDHIFCTKKQASRYGVQVLTHRILEIAEKMSDYIKKRNKLNNSI